MGWRSVGRMPYAPTVLPEKHAAFRTFHAQGGAKRGAMPGISLSLVACLYSRRSH